LSSEQTRTHTAIHVLKGAVQQVLGAKWTSSVYVSGTHGRLTVQFDRRPTAEEVIKVEKAANGKVSEGAEIIEFEMEKGEAEGHFGDTIYDLFPVPSNLTRLKIVKIGDWNINCCIESHVDNTSAVGRMKLGTIRFRNSRKELEIEFDLAE